MEPRYAPGILEWEGWHRPNQGPAPKEGTRCRLRVKREVGNLVPEIWISEVGAYYSRKGWTDGRGNLLEGLNVVAWRED